MPWGKIKDLKSIVGSLVVALTCVAFAAPALADKRVALVIGNSSYQNVPRLDNPRNDARLMADTLQGLGFQLIGGGPQVDLDKQAFDAVLQKFGNAVQGADVALFYYAGHGVQVAGKNFLVPVAANPTKEADVYLQMVDTNVVLSQMDGAGTKLNIVLLDACRNNPFGGRGLRAAGGGLAQMQAPGGTLISYATQPGNVAQDGDGSNSPYTKALTATMRKPGLGLFETFNEVGLSVQQATGGSQQPWVSSSPIATPFSFASPSAGAASAAAPAQQAVPGDDAAHRDFELAQKLDSREVWDAFLEKYPTGFLASAARSRLEALRTNHLAMVAPSQSVPNPAPATGTIAGSWNGIYYYPNANNKQQPVNFVFSFAAVGCDGRSEEANTFGNKNAPKLFAILSCTDGVLRPGQMITIKKTYDGTGGVSHSVIYTGTVSPDMRSISGQWAINNARGTFSMSR